MTQPRPRGLGRGVDALIPMSREGEAMVPLLIAVDQIRPSHLQVRTRFDAEPLGGEVLWIGEERVVDRDQREFGTLLCQQHFAGTRADIAFLREPR